MTSAPDPAQIAAALVVLDWLAERTDDTVRPCILLVEHELHGVKAA